MLYRNRTFENRYEKSREDYNAEDRVPMMRYMEEKGSQVPKAVCFANIRAFIDVPLGNDISRWAEEILERAFPLDAQWFITHWTSTFLSFCCPAADSSDEFVLPENAFDIFDGLREEQQWTDWHVFTPISPHIIIVLRKNILQKNVLPELENSRQKILKSILSICFEDPCAAQSSLIDLPLEKPQIVVPPYS
jgi:hypothetical protein